MKHNICCAKQNQIAGCTWSSYDLLVFCWMTCIALGTTYQWEIRGSLYFKLMPNKGRLRNVQLSCNEKGVPSSIIAIIFLKFKKTNQNKTKPLQKIELLKAYAVRVWGTTFQENILRKIIKSKWRMISPWLQQVGGTRSQSAYTKQKHGIARGLGHWIMLKGHDLISLTSNSIVFASHILFLEVFPTSGITKWPVGCAVVDIWRQARFSVDWADLCQGLTAAQLSCQAEAALWSEAGYVYPATALHTMQACPKHPEMQPGRHRNFRCDKNTLLLVERA